MIIPIASDHAGFKAKEMARQILEKMGHMPVDFGTHSEESVDYPEFAVEVARKVGEGEYETGILICGSGQGMCMTANKVPKVRGAVVHDEEEAALTRLHTNANRNSLPGRQQEEKQIEKIRKHWLETEFEGRRH